MTKKKTLVYLITCFDKGGAELQVANLATEFADDFDVHVVSMLSVSEPWFDVAQVEFQFHTLGMQRGKLRPADWFKALALFKRIGPDLVHSHMVHANLLARLIKPLLRFRLICTAHSVFEVSGKLHWLYKKTKGIADLNTQVSHAGLIKYQQEGLFGPNDIVAYNGIELPAPESIDDQVIDPNFLRIGFLAKLRPEKNLEQLCQVALELKRCGIPFKLFIAGDGEKAQYVNQFISEHELTNQVVMLGLISDLKSFFSNIDVLVQTSHHEGLPTVLIEAGAYKTPVIATNVGGSAEIVDSGRSGYLTPAGDSVAMVRALRKFYLLDTSARRRLAQHANQIAHQRFDICIATQHWQDVYGSLIGEL